MTESKICTCPSGDGSLVHPCPAHPAVEQAGGDERAAFEAWATHLPMDRQPLRPDLYMPPTQWAWEAWQFRAALAQAEDDPVIGCLCGMPMTEGHHSPDGCCNLEEFAPPAQAEAEREMREAFEQARDCDGLDFIDGEYWLRPIPDHPDELASVNSDWWLWQEAWKQAGAALAHDEQEQAAHEIRLLANALGECIQAAGITAPGVPLTGPQLLMFAEDLKRDLQRSSLAQPSPASVCATPAGENCPGDGVKSYTKCPEQPEAERPEVVAYRTIGRHTKHQHPHYALNYYKQNAEDQAAHWRERGCEVSEDELMTVAQHERIVGALRAENAKLSEALDECDGDRWKLRSERDSALARVAELERQEPVALANRGLHAFWVKWTEAAAGLYGPGIKLYAAPVAQAQQLNDLDKQCRDDVARALGLRPNQERGFAWSYLLASIKSCVKASGDSAQAQHSVPGDIMRDAQRYRWLRDQQFYFSFSTENSDAGISSCTAGMSSRFKNLSWVDAAIDSAIAAAPGKEVGHE